MRPKRITLARRLVQLASFALIMYGAFIWTTPLDSALLPRIPAGSPRTTQYTRDRILWVSGQESVIGAYLPVLACRFVAKGGFFKSCSLHLLSENMTWRTSLKTMLPQLFLVTLLLVLAGRFWCGWTCPLGAIQDVMTWVRQRFARAPVTLSENTKRFFFKTRHFFLFSTLIISMLIAFPVLGRTGANDSLFLIYCQLCPGRLVYPPLGGVNPCWYDTSSLTTTFLSGLGWLTFASFFLGFLVPRFWCRVCAIGALSSYFSRGSLLQIEKGTRKCTSCGACKRCCPVDVERVYREKERRVVTDPECIGCLTCVEVCPEKECLQAKWWGKRVAGS